MDAYAKPLRRCADAAECFVRDGRLRLLHVVASADLLDAALDVIGALEYHAANRSPFVRLEAPYLRKDRGWAARAASLREQHDARGKAMAEHGYALPPLPAAPPVGENPIVAFATQLHQVAGARCRPLAGLIVVIAPRVVEETAAFEAELEWLLAIPALRDVRFVLVDAETPSLTGAPGRLGAACLAFTCRVDETEARREVGARFEAAAAAPEGAPGPAQVGAAWPRGVTPPRRTRLPVPTAAEAARIAATLGMPVAYFGGGLRAFRDALLKGAMAARNGDPLAALRAQREAVDKARAAGLVRETFVAELLLATYAVQAEQRPKAHELYMGVADRAVPAGFPDIGAQALLAAASLRLVERDKPGASVLYGRAGAVGRDGGAVPLAIEGFRMAGDLRREEGDEEQARRLYTEAMTLASKMPPAQAGRTSAPLAGRALADICRRLGLDDQARTLEAQCAAMES